MSNHEPSESGQPPARRAGGLEVKIGGVALTLLLAIACLGFSYWMYRADPPRTSLKLPENRALFTNWGKPDLVLVLSAEQHGYLQPCGCSEPQKGGLVRRYNFLQILRDKGWSVVALDLGDIAQAKPPVDTLTNLQQVAKYKYAMLALKAMDYTAVGIGPIEANNLFKLYGAYPLQEDKPSVLSANLRNREKEYVPGIDNWAQTTPKGSDITVGVTSIMGAVNAEARSKNDSVQFDFGGAALKELRSNAKKVDVGVLLYEGYTTAGQKGKAEAVACAEQFPEYQVVLALSGENDEPAGKPIVVGKSIVVTLGHKGKYVGVVGVYKPTKQGDPYQFRYQLVELGEEYITPKAEEKNHPILKLMEDYTAELKSEGYLTKYPQRKHPLQVQVVPGQNKPEYVGTDACKGCHAAAFKVWSKSAHSNAYNSLAKPKKPNPPSNRQYDPECIVCHTVGFGYESGFFDENKTDFLKNVGCESCHGPCSEHIAAEAANNADVKKWRKAINPWKYLPAAQHKLQMAEMCTKCHNIENDVHWVGPDALDKHWDAGIKHYKDMKPTPASTPMPK